MNVDKIFAAVVRKKNRFSVAVLKMLHLSPFVITVNYGIHLEPRKLSCYSGRLRAGRKKESRNRNDLNWDVN